MHVAKILNWSYIVPEFVSIMFTSEFAVDEKV